MGPPNKQNNSKNPTHKLGGEFRQETLRVVAKGLGKSSETYADPRQGEGGQQELRVEAREVSVDSGMDAANQARNPELSS